MSQKCALILNIDIEGATDYSCLKNCSWSKSKVINRRIIRLQHLFICLYLSIKHWGLCCISRYYSFHFLSKLVFCPVVFLRFWTCWFKDETWIFVIALNKRLCIVVMKFPTSFNLNAHRNHLVFTDISLGPNINVSCILLFLATTSHQITLNKSHRVMRVLGSTKIFRSIFEANA